MLYFEFEFFFNDKSISVFKDRKQELYIHVYNRESFKKIPEKAIAIIVNSQLENSAKGSVKCCYR